MYEGMTDTVLLERLLSRVSNKMDKRPSSLIYDTHSSAAIEFQTLYIELEYLIQNSYGDTAAREFLILLCKDRGITPEPATKAILKGEFTPANIDVTGERFNVGELNYIVTEKTADGQYHVECETTGEIGNQYLGNMIPMGYIAGLETATLTEVLIPGEDEEDTEVLRQRYFDSFNEQTFGGNRSDYLSKVKGIEGVGAVKVTRVWNGDIRPADMIPTDKVTAWYESVISTLNEEVALWLTTVYMAAVEKKLTVGGTVLITIVDSDNYGEASAALVDLVQEQIDPEQNAGEGYGLAPIGHVVNVKSAEQVKINVTTEISFNDGYSWSSMTGVISEAIESYLLELRKEWSNNTNTVVRISQIESRILSINGVADITGTKINGSENNLILGNYEIPIIGGVSA